MSDLTDREKRSILVGAQVALERIDSAYLAGVRAGLEAAAKIAKIHAARRTCDAIRALDATSIATRTQGAGR